MQRIGADSTRIVPDHRQAKTCVVVQLADGGDARRKTGAKRKNRKTDKGAWVLRLKQATGATWGELSAHVGSISRCAKVCSFHFPGVFIIF